MIADAFADVQRIASTVFGVPLEEITPDASPDTVAQWDSVQHIYLVLALEEHFGRQLAVEDVEHLKTIGEIASFFER